MAGPVRLPTRAFEAAVTATDVTDIANMEHFLIRKPGANPLLGCPVPTEATKAVIF